MIEATARTADGRAESFRHTRKKVGDILHFGNLPIVAGSYDMLYRVGRLLQLAGLIILPVAIAGDLAEKLELKQSLALSAVGVAVFFGGWAMQQGRKP
jgi:hypothetical protein